MAAMTTLVVAIVGLGLLSARSIFRALLSIAAALLGVAIFATIGGLLGFPVVGAAIGAVLAVGLLADHG
jgi:hypothetical protein